MKNTKQQYSIFYTEENKINNNGTRFGTLEMLNNDFPQENWAIIPAEQTPSNWEDMTVVNRQLVLASTETIAERQEAKLIAHNEAVRSQRASEYSVQTDHLLFEAMEQFAKKNSDNNEFQTWLNAKERVRSNNPKPSLNNNSKSLQNTSTTQTKQTDN